MKRTQSQYFRSDSVCYSEVEFKKPCALIRDTDVNCVDDLVEMLVLEGMREGGYQANPFTQYIIATSHDPWVGAHRTVDRAAIVMMQYVGLCGIEGNDDSHMTFEARSFRGGVFDKVKFIGPLAPLHSWLNITEERVDTKENNSKYGIYDEFCLFKYCFRVKKR